MLAIIAALVVSGDCYGPMQTRQQVIYQRKYAAVPMYVVADTGKDLERLRQLEDAVLKLTAIAETQQLMLQQQNGLQLQSQLQVQARQVLNTRCVTCHRGPSPKGNIDLSGELSIGDKLLAAELVLDGSMPPEDKPALSDEEAKLLYDWSREDRDAVRQYLRGAAEPQLK